MKKLSLSIFKAITNFQRSLSNRCHNGYEDTIARIIIEQLEVVFLQNAGKKTSNEKETRSKNDCRHIKLGNLWSFRRMEKK